VVARLKKIDSTSAYGVYQPMLLGDPSRPSTSEHVFQRLGFSDPSERIAHHGFDQIEDPKRGSAVGLDPIP